METRIVLDVPHQANKSTEHYINLHTIVYKI